MLSPPLVSHTEKAIPRLQHSVSKSPTPNWQSPSVVIGTQPHASCVTFSKSLFLSVSFHLCEMGLIHTLLTLQWGSSEIAPETGLHAVKVHPGGGSYSLHCCEQDLKMATTVTHPALAGQCPRHL